MNLLIDVKQLISCRTIKCNLGRHLLYRVKMKCISIGTKLIHTAMDNNHLHYHQFSTN